MEHLNAIKTTYNYSALYSEIVLLVKPDLHFLPALEKSEYQIDLHKAAMRVSSKDFLKGLPSS